MTWDWDAFGLVVDVRVREARAPERLVLEVADSTDGSHVLESQARR